MLLHQPLPRGRVDRPIDLLPVRVVAIALVFRRCCDGAPSAAAARASCEASPFTLHCSPCFPLWQPLLFLRPLPFPLPWPFPLCAPALPPRPGAPSRA